MSLTWSNRIARQLPRVCTYISTDTSNRAVSYSAGNSLRLRFLEHWNEETHVTRPCHLSGVVRALCFIRITALSLAQTVQHQIVGQLMNCELEKICEEAVVAHFSLVHGILRAAHGSIVGWGTMLQVERSRDLFLMRSLDFLNWPHPSSLTVALGLTQLLTEMSVRNLPGGKGRPVREAKITEIREPII
jgi:hypothetical protein